MNASPHKMNADLHKMNADPNNMNADSQYLSKIIKDWLILIFDSFPAHPSCRIF
jgi:hypothetical protein